MLFDTCCVPFSSYLKIFQTCDILFTNYSILFLLETLAKNTCRGSITSSFAQASVFGKFIALFRLQDSWLRKFMKQYFMKCICFYTLNNLKPLSHQTVMPQRLYSVLKPCQRAVESPRNTPTNIKFVSYSVYTMSSQRPYSVHTTFPQQLLQRVHSAHTARSRHAHSILTAVIAFKSFYLVLFYFE